MRKILQTRVFGLSLILAIFSVVIILAMATQVSSFNSSGDSDNRLSKFWFFDRFYLDCLIGILIGSLLINANIIGRILAYLWSGLFFLVYLLQFLSVYISGEFVTFLAVDNTNHISLLINPQSSVFILVSAVLFLAFIFVLEVKFNRRIQWKSLCLVITGILFVSVGVHFHESWVSEKVISVRDGFYSHRSNRIAHKSPMESLYKVLFRASRTDLPPFTDEDVNRALSYGITMNPTDRYPLVKDVDFQTSLPFKPIARELEKPNVIVIFAEGMSARTLGMYDDFRPGLTPNLEVFSESTLIVDNYYNHTHATYRGLLGQLCSFYPTQGGHGGWDTHYERVKEINYLCLNHLFSEQDYQTVFFDTHRRDHGYIDEMMAQLSFEEIINAEEVVERYLHEAPLRRDALSDNQFFRGLIEILKDKQEDNDSRPFFMAMYNLGTHTFQKPRKDGRLYPNAENYVLDSIHNYDYAFGRFWQYFKNSDYFDNTIIFFTSDHAHYPDRDFRALMSEDKNYQSYFVDQIPLMIYDPGKKMPRRFDAEFVTSINFAPTVANWMGFTVDKSSFVGSSIFNQTKDNIAVSIASADIEHYLISENGIESNIANENPSEQLEFVGRVIDTLRQLEQHDRIWPD